MIDFKLGKLSHAIASAAKHVQAVTKQLKLQKVSKTSDKRKLVISTNWLNSFNFAEGQKVVEISNGSNQGFIVRPATANEPDAKMVYSRGYAKRENRETQMDIRHQGKLNESLGNTTHAHITMMYNMIIIMPMAEHADKVSNEAGYIELTRNPKNGLYDSVMQTVEIIKEKAYCSIDVTSDPDFACSQEKTLLEIQLRRLGYNLSSDANGTLSARINGVNPTSRTDIKSVFSTDSLIKARSKINNQFDVENPLSVIGVCSAGVDIHAIQAEGFATNQLLEWRPPEKGISKPPQMQQRA